MSAAGRSGSSNRAAVPYPPVMRPRDLLPRLTLLAVLAVGFAVPARAHDFWIEP